VLQRLVRFGPEPTSPEDIAAAPPARWEELDLLPALRELSAAQGSRELGLVALFLGPDRLAHVRRRLRLAPERISFWTLAQVLRRTEQPALKLAREAQRLATLYALSWPVDRTWRITSGFGPRIHPVIGTASTHRGLDISMPVGTSVRAPAAGRVASVREGPVNGRWVELDHGAGVRTVYCHLSRVDVTRGQKVAAGELVALSGDTGRVTGPHLHFQVKLSGDWVDPLSSRASDPRFVESLRPMPAPVADTTQASLR
jgi:murein DD-endopeptidase MepM/ murein hydrolase activator NlpD